MAAHSQSSLSYSSPSFQLTSRLGRLTNSANHLGFLNSPFFPKNMRDFTRHQAEWQGMLVVAQKRKLESRVRDMEGRKMELAREGKREKRWVGKGNKEEEGCGGSEEEEKDRQEEERTNPEAELKAINKQEKEHSTNIKKSTTCTIRPKPGHTPILNLPTSLWSGPEPLLPTRRPYSLLLTPHRSPWPDLPTLKATGPQRADLNLPRHLPYPRRDILSKAALVREYEVLAQRGMEKQEILEHLVRKSGDDLPWADRELVVFEGFDFLESVSRERDEEEEEEEKREAMTVPQRDHLQPLSNTTENEKIAYVSNINERTSLEELKAVLSSFGELVYVNITRKKECAFVEFATAEGYQAAVAANPIEVQGEMVVVEAKRSKVGSYGFGHVGSPTGYGNRGVGRRRKRSLGLGLSPAQAARRQQANPEAAGIGANGENRVLDHGWVFDEEVLKGMGDWEDLLDAHLECD